jgi:glycosyltransferase involved in cell wall biosynthesis
VSTDLGTLPEIVEHGETGLVVSPDPARLADAWRSLLEDAPLRGKLGAAARRRAERCFSPARLAEEVERLYQETFAAPAS